MKFFNSLTGTWVLWGVIMALVITIAVLMFRSHP